jgi:hypothetical protein
VFDERDAWSEHRPSAQEENELVRLHGFAGYGKWYLGIDDAYLEDTKAHYELPYGDFENVHRCGVLTAERRAGQYKHFDIENAAAHLHGMIDGRAMKDAPVTKRPRAVQAGKTTRDTRHQVR